MELSEECDSFGAEAIGEAPCLGVDDERITLVGLVFESAWGLRRALLRTVQSELGITGQSFDILIRLLRSPNGQMRMADLAAQTGLTPSGLTRAIDRLVQSQFIDRVSCSDDRRGAFAVLTAQGRTRTEVALLAHRREIDAILDGVLEPQDEAQLVNLLRAVRDRIRPEAAQITKDEVEVLSN